MFIHTNQALITSFYIKKVSIFFILNYEIKNKLLIQQKFTREISKLTVENGCLISSSDHELVGPKVGTSRERVVRHFVVKPFKSTSPEFYDTFWKFQMIL